MHRTQANNQRQWSSSLFKPLDMSAIPGYPRQMPPKYEKWLPKFTGIDAISVEEHMSNFWAFFQLHPVSDDVEDLVMKLFSATLLDASRRWYHSLPDGSIKTMDKLEEAFLKRWSIKEDPNMLLTRLNSLWKHENETIREFHTRFETLLQKIPVSHHPTNNFLVYIYTKAFTGQLGYLLRDKNPQTIQEAQELATKIEGNLHSSKIEPFSNPRAKMDIKPKIVHNAEPSSDICASLAKLQMTMDGMMKNQELMMNRIVNLERAQSQAPRVPYKGQFQKGNQIYKPKNDQEVPNTLAPTNVVDENPWCLQCSEAHWEHECPYNNGGHDQVNNVGHIIEGPQICLNITPEEHREGIKEAARKARMEVINNLDQESKEKLKKQEFQVYRRKKLNQPISTVPAITQTKPPPLDILLPKTSKTERVDLNFDFEGALSKMHVTIPLREVIKVPSVKERFDNFFKGSDGPMDPPIMLQVDHFRVQYDEHPPFFMTLLMNNKSLNNCMLDSGAGANMMSLKVMQQIGLKVTRPYRNVCGFESRAIPTHGVIENVEVCLKEYPERIIHIDIVVVDVPDVWGMLLSRKFASKLGGTLEMDLTYVNIPLNNGTIGRLPNVPMTRTHVQEASDPIKDDKAHEQIMESLPEFSPDDMPFATEEDFDQIQWPKKEEYQQLLDKYKDKEVGTVKLLKTGESDILIRPSQQEVFTAESHPPPSAQYTRVVQETTKFKIREYKEGDVVWMWDTKKGEPTNVKGSTQFWLGPFKVGRKSVDDSYYLSTLEGRRRPLPVSGHLLKPHQGGGT
jgi:hypothetical protein